MTTLSNTLVYSVSQAVNLAGSDSLSMTIPLQAPAQEDTYVLSASVESNGGTYEIFATYLDVAAAKIFLPVVLRN